MTRPSRGCRGLLLWLLLCGGGVAAHAEETIEIITIPISASFVINNTNQATTGAEATIEYAEGSLLSGQRLHISLQANSAAFSTLGGTAIPAGKISWDGAFPGVLSADCFTRVYLSPQNPTAGTHTFTWSLGSLSDLPGLRGGNQTLTATWKIESI